MSFPRPCTAIVFGVVSTLAATVIHPPSVRAEFDHLTCFKAGDDEAAPVVAPPLTLSTAMGGVGSGCEIKKKAHTVCLRTEKNGGNDPRGPIVANFVCYKVKCESPPVVPAADLIDQFAGRIIELKKIFTVCAPGN